jgi:TRAP-type C4-dicarboxylate transport system substrate-binding protein
MRPSRELVARIALSIAVASGALLLVGCGGATQADKAGGSGRPVVLRLGTPNGPDRPESDDIEYFAARVKQLSGGSVTVKIVWSAAGGPEQPVATMVRRGKLDAALIATRAWDMEGVTTLRALQAPFLITSQALENRVVAGPLAGEMLAGLRKAGVTGLALLPADLLHPFGFGKAFRAPRDFAGSTIRVPVSTTSYRLVRALRGIPVSPDADAFNLDVRNGRVDGAEWYLELGNTLPVGRGPTTATANVTFYPKVHGLVVNTKAFQRLTDRQRAILRRAAVDTRRYVIRTNVSEAAAAAQFCRNGGAIVASSPADLAGLERATAPLYATLERDPLTRRLIERIRQLERGTRADSPIPLCEPAKAAAAGPTTKVRAGPTIPDGIYRKEITEQALLAAGVGKTDARWNYGLHTLTIKDGRWRDTSGIRSPCSGAIRYSGRRVIFTTACGSSTTSLVLNATWRFDGGELRFLGLANVFDRVFWGGRPWRKIG